MKKDYSFPVGVMTTIAVGIGWTLAAGTLWQWVPIAGALGAFYAVNRIIEAQYNKDKEEK